MTLGIGMLNPHQTYNHDCLLSVVILVFSHESYFLLSHPQVDVATQKSNCKCDYMNEYAT